MFWHGMTGNGSFHPVAPSTTPSVKYLLLAVLLLASCAHDPAVPKIPGPASSVTRDEAIATAYAYTQVKWTPEPRHILHGRDADGILVHTPDTGLSRHSFSNGWWTPGKEAQGMAYQWGGFDTPEQFAASLKRGRVAGDISTAEKRRLGDAGTSRHACGIDCSGFISRCWRLPRPYSTKQLPEICDRLPDWGELKPGDILLNDRHVLLFARWQVPGSIALIYESGPYPVWRVNAAAIPTEFLLERGYEPWRYRRILD